MNIGIIGQGFVGTATREGLKNYYNVLTFDKDPSKQSNCISLDELVMNTNLSFLCVPTPMRISGECDTRIIESALVEIEECVLGHSKENYIVILKSTVPPGTLDRLQDTFKNVILVFNPEFLTEANSIEDFKSQNRIIIGCNNESATEIVCELFRKVFPAIPIIKTKPAVAEMVKYVCNTFLTVKVSYANEIYQICQALEIPYDNVVRYAALDTRLGHSHWNVPGPDGDFGYGGHCFPKDISGLNFTAKQLGVDTTMLEAAMSKNKLVRKDKDWESQIGRAVSLD